MSNAHVVDLLSEYLDNRLGDAERERIKSHVAVCDDCRGELGALRSVSRMMSDLPKKDLPVGFLTRLNAKRKAETAAAPSFAFPMPFSPRMAAFAMTGLLISVVFYREVRYRLAPGVLSEISGAASMDDSMSEVDSAMTPEEVARMRAEVAAKQAAAPEWTGVVDEERAASMQQARATDSAAGAAVPGAAPAAIAQFSDVRGGAAYADAKPAPSDKDQEAASPAPEPEASIAQLQARLDRVKAEAVARHEAKKSAAAPGRPVGVLSNEELQDHLEKERQRLGIQEVVAKADEGPATAWEGVPDQPMTREQAMDSMRKMASNLSSINEINRWKKAPTVPLTGETPGLLASGPPPSRPLQSGPQLNIPASESPSSLGFMQSRVSATRGSDFGSLAAVRGISGGAGGVDVIGQADDSPASAEKDGYQAATVAGKVKGRRIKPRVLTASQQWSSTTGGLGSFGAAVIKSQAQFDDMRRRLGFEAPARPIDFTKEMVIGVFAPGSATEARLVEIVETVVESGEFFVRYRIKTTGAPGPSAGYHVMVLPAVAPQPTFQLVP